MKAKLLSLAGLSVVALFAGLSSVRAGVLAFDKQGNLFFEGRNTGEIVKFAADGTKSTFATATPDAPINGDIAIDEAGNIYACANFTTILKYTPDGKSSVFAVDVGKTWPTAMVIDPAGNLFVAVRDTIFKFTPDGTRSTFATGVDAYGLAFDQSGNLFASDSHGENGQLVSAIVRFTPDGQKSTVANEAGYAMVFDKSGNLFVSETDGVYEFTPDGKKSEFAKADSADGLVFDPSGNLIGCGGNNTLFKLASDGTRSVFKWKAAAGAPEEQGEDSADGLPPNYAKNYLVAQTTLSPDRKFGIIYPTTDDEEFPGGKNYLVSLKPFAILTKLETKRPYFKNESHGGLMADWSDDGSVALITLDAKWGPGDIFLVELKNGKVTRTTNILKKAHDLLVPDFKNAKAANSDFIFESEDTPSFQLDGSKAVRINAGATTDPKGADEGRVWDGHLEAVWDIPQAKFTSQKVTRDFAGVRQHEE